MERKHLFRRIAVHVLASVLVVTAGQIVLRHVTPFPGPFRGDRVQRGTDGQSRTAATGESRPERPQGVPGGYAGFRAGLDIFIYWAALSVCHAVAFFRYSEQRERRTLELEARLSQAQLQALRMQLNPHFLFNTLNAISTLVHTNPNVADEMITDLSELLRISLDSSDEQEIPLCREVEYLRCYLDIEKTRFGDRLRIEQNVPLELQNAYVPTFILQPLVENAIRHGIEPQREPGLITISAQKEGNTLLLTVTDNGRGIDEEALTKGRGGRGGIGLANTRGRLQQLYGPAQSFQIGKTNGRGCRAALRIPLHFEPIHRNIASEPA